jgi:hypothetical protein
LLSYFLLLQKQSEHYSMLLLTGQHLIVTEFYGRACSWGRTTGLHNTPDRTNSRGRRNTATAVRSLRHRLVETLAGTRNDPRAGHGEPEIARVLAPAAELVAESRRYTNRSTMGRP